MKIAWWSVTKHMCLPNRSPGPFWGLIWPVRNGLQGSHLSSLCCAAQLLRTDSPAMRDPGPGPREAPVGTAPPAAPSIRPHSAGQGTGTGLWSSPQWQPLPNVREPCGMGKSLGLSHQWGHGSFSTGEPTRLGIQEYSLPCKCSAIPQNPIIHPFSCLPFLKQCLRTVPGSP